MNLLQKLKWPGIFILVLLMAIIRPIHQDDGWYASFAFRMLSDFHINDNLSFFSYADSNGGNDIPAGFLFSLLQVPFYALFGVNVLAARIFNAIMITALLFIIHLLLKKIAPKFSWIVVVLLLVHPVFYYHFYNRPESLALFLSASSFYLMLTAENSKWRVFFAFFIWAFILDVHPIAIFTVAGVGLHYWFYHRKQTLLIAAGGILGLILYVALNYAFNGIFGLFAASFGQVPQNFGDHYVPLFQSDLKDYLRIAIDRFQTLKGSILFSLIWVIIPLFLIRKCSIKGYVGLVLFNTVCFWVMATFLTEASSNGFALYSLYVFTFLFIVLINAISDSYSFKPMWNWIAVAPMLLFMVKSDITWLNRYYHEFATFNKSYAEIKTCIPDGSKVLMRPTFAFNMGTKRLHSDYTFGIFNVMADNHLNFEDALKLRKYDFIMLDERNMNEELLIDKRNNAVFNNPAYNKYLQTGITSMGFDSLVQKGFLQPICEYLDPSHGKTICYKVNLGSQN